MSRRLLTISLSAFCVALAGPVAGAHAAPSAPRPVDMGQVQLIQGVPGVTASVTVDGAQVDSGVDVGSVMPLELTPGAHRVAFKGSDGSTATVSLKVASGQSSDVVFHLPASLGGEPVLSTYKTPSSPIGPGKARVLVAHTATLAPADVEVDGQVVFNDIANGEFAEAEVPAGTLSVALIPSQGTGEAVLGPLDVTLKPKTVTMVYAVGRPDDGTMQVITRSSAISSDGTVVPDAIDTGSAGLAADVSVAQFGQVGQVGQQASSVASQSGSVPWLWVTTAGLLVLLAGALGRARRTARVLSHR